MSHDPEFMNLLDNLLKNPKASERARAAALLAQYVDQLNDDEYELAKTALNRAMTDSDPMVLMAVMNTMTKYNRQSAEIEMELFGDAQEDIAPQKAHACKVCGRPEALIPEGGCERDDCPYSS